MTVKRAKVAVLASGGGSNLQALIDYFAAIGDRRAADIVLVASNRSEAGALARARAAGVPVSIIRSARHENGEEMLPLLQRHAVDLVVLAGYLQLVPPDVTRAFAGRIVNVHPAPLPDFGGAGMYGRRVHHAVLSAGVRFSGPTVHFVDDVYDHGATIAHWPVPVLPGDDDQAISVRVLSAEHLLLPRAVQAVASGAPLPERLILPAFGAAMSDAELEAIADDWFLQPRNSAR